MKHIIHVNDVENDDINDKNISNTHKDIKKSKSRIKKNTIPTEITWKNVQNKLIKTYKVKILKDFCIKNQLKRSGRKNELIQRIHFFF